MHQLCLLLLLWFFSLLLTQLLGKIQTSGDVVQGKPQKDVKASVLLPTKIRTWTTDIPYSVVHTQLRQCKMILGHRNRVLNNIELYSDKVMTSSSPFWSSWLPERTHQFENNMSLTLSSYLLGPFLVKTGQAEGSRVWREFHNCVMFLFCLFYGYLLFTWNHNNFSIYDHDIEN